MVDTVRRETLQPVRAPKVQPTLLTGQSGQIRAGTGTLNAPRIASPIRLQYIPQPTQLGRNIGTGIAQMADQVNDIALKLADREARTGAALDAQKSYAELSGLLIGSNKQPGILLKSSTEFTDGFNEANSRIDEYIEKKAQSIEGGLRRSYYVSHMSSTSQAFKKELRNKYKIESLAAKKQGFEARDTVNVSNALLLTAGPDVRTALLAATAEKVDRGENLQLAFDEVIVNYNRALFGQPQGRQRYKLMSESGVYDGMSGSAIAELEILVYADLAREAKMRKDMQVLEKVNAKEDWNSKNDSIVKGMYNLKNSPVELFEYAQREQEIATLNNPDDATAVNGVKALYEIYSKAVEVPESAEATNLISKANFLDYTPTKLALEAQVAGIELPRSSLTSFTQQFFSSESRAKVNTAVSNWAKEMAAHVPTSKGLNEGTKGYTYFVTTPAGKTWLAKRTNELRDSAMTAYGRDKNGGMAAVKQELENATTWIQDPNSFSSEMRITTMNLVSTAPPGMNALQTLQKYQKIASGEVPGVAQHEDAIAIAKGAGYSDEAIEDYTKNTSENDLFNATIDMAFSHYYTQIKASGASMNQKVAWARALQEQRRLIISIHHSSEALGLGRPAPVAPDKPTTPDKPAESKSVGSKIVGAVKSKLTGQ